MTTDEATAGTAPAGTDESSDVRIAVPGDASLVPGVSGARHDATASRALVAALHEALRGAARVRVTVAGAPRAAASDRVHDVDAATPSAATRPVPDLGAQGIDTAWVPWRFTGNDGVAGAPRAGVAATVALLALGAAGWDGPVEVLDVPADRGGRAGREGATVRVERAC